MFFKSDIAYVATLVNISMALVYRPQINTQYCSYLPLEDEATTKYLYSLTLTLPPAAAVFKTHTTLCYNHNSTSI